MTDPSLSARQAICDALVEGKEVLAFTGAGISVPSGIPDFRSQQGLWARFPPEEYATIEVFQRAPEKFWQLNHEIISNFTDVSPNPGHYALAKLESLGLKVTIVTQNIDGLHQAAGNTCVHEIHGSKDNLKCLHCKALYPLLDYPLEKGKIPKCANCSAALKPDVVYFGEALPTAVLERSLMAARSSKICLVIGTSALVFPAARIPSLAYDGGAMVCEFNLETTGLTQSGQLAHFVQGPVEVTLPQLADLVEQALS
jgi:NAD-dependent deacetylase